MTRLRHSPLGQFVRYTFVVDLARKEAILTTSVPDLSVTAPFKFPHESPEEVVLGCTFAVAQPVSTSFWFDDVAVVTTP